MYDEENDNSSIKIIWFGYVWRHGKKERKNINDLDVIINDTIYCTVIKTKHTYM